MSKRVDPKLPQFFGRPSRMPYGVRPVAEQIAPDTTTAYYQSPVMDGTRDGYYCVNLYKPEERPKYEIPVLTIHEAVPGHHLQIALAQELGEEMGLYDDPYDKFGQLTYEMWRAVRLVVDTGLHHRRWTWQQAIDYFKANAALGDRFDLRAFHDVALGSGALPLDVLAANVRRWIGETQQQ